MQDTKKEILTKKFQTGLAIVGEFHGLWRLIAASLLLPLVFDSKHFYNATANSNRSSCFLSNCIQKWRKEQ